ncbi:hypothetical protein Gpo141_00004481 [Globisporangium polare]
MDDVIKSLGLGLALGLVLITVLAAFPGEPFDYDSSSNKTISSNGGTKKREAYDTEAAADEVVDTPQTPPASPCSHPAVDADNATKVSECSTAATSSISNPKAAAQQDAEKERQREKIRKLQTLLGLEKHKMDELVARAEADASATTSAADTSFSATSTYGGYLDVAFYLLILAALVYVLQSEYEIDVLHLVAHMFPREVETATQVLSKPTRWFFQQLTGVTNP